MHFRIPPVRGRGRQDERVSIDFNTHTSSSPLSPRASKKRTEQLLVIGYRDILLKRFAFRNRMKLSALLPFLGFSSAVAILDNYKLWCVGNCDKDVKTSTTPGVVLMGGGVNLYEHF
jgi:hypothetical protein